MFFPGAQMSNMTYMAPMTMNSAAPIAHGMAHMGAANVAGGAGTSSGLLARLFGGLGAGGGQSFNIMSMLQNTQRVVGMVQTVTPMVQQYGPIIRNLPALYRIMKSSPNSDNTNTETATTGESIQSSEIKNSSSDNSTEIDSLTENTAKDTNTTVIKPEIENKTSSKQTAIQTSTQAPKPKTINGIPAPKMYI